MIALLRVMQRMFRIRYYEHTDKETYEAGGLMKLAKAVNRRWWKIG